MYVWGAGQHVAGASERAAYLGAIGVERGLGVVGLYGLCIELERLVPLLVAEGIVALVFELDSLVWRAAHGGWSEHEGWRRQGRCGGQAQVALVRWRASSDGGGDLREQQQ